MDRWIHTCSEHPSKLSMITRMAPNHPAQQTPYSCMHINPSSSVVNFLHHPKCNPRHSPDPTYFFPAYIFVQLFAFFTNSLRSSRYSLPMFASTASSGTGSTSSWRANCRTAPIFELGFHSSGRSMPRHMEPFSSLDTFG